MAKNTTTLTFERCVHAAKLASLDAANLAASLTPAGECSKRLARARDELIGALAQLERPTYAGG